MGLNTPVPIGYNNNIIVISIMCHPEYTLGGGRRKGEPCY